MEIALRLVTPQDMPFIYNSWLKSYTENNKDFKRMGQGVYFSNYKKVLSRILDDALIVIACNPDDKEQVYGYVVAEEHANVCHYIYVKYTFRKLGIARRLLKNIHPELSEVPLACTFANKNYDLLRTKYLLTYNPFLR
jgi:GNAT superfamily N-acetyltransferase